LRRAALNRPCFAARRVGRCARSHNNVQFYTMAYVDAATYQILGNLKIVTTGFLFWVALKRYLSRIQVQTQL